MHTSAATGLLSWSRSHRVRPWQGHSNLLVPAHERTCTTAKAEKRGAVTPLGFVQGFLAGAKLRSLYSA